MESVRCPMCKARLFDSPHFTRIKPFQNEAASSSDILIKCQGRKNLISITLVLERDL